MVKIGPRGIYMISTVYKNHPYAGLAIDAFKKDFLSNQKGRISIAGTAPPPIVWDGRR